MALAGADYGELIVQRNDPNPLKRHLSMYARRRLRRAIRIAKDPLPLLQRKAAASRLPAQSIAVDPAKGYIFLPSDFVFDSVPLIELAHRKWREHRDVMDRTGRYFLKFNKYMPADEIADVTRVALQPNALKVTSDYLGSLPVLKDISIWWTRPSTRKTGAQNWHIDSIPDTRSLRFFVALTDIDTDNGPLTFLDATTTARLVRQMEYLGGVIEDSYVRERFGPQVTMACYKAGEAIALDTGACLHCGSTNMKRDRLMLSISFSSYYLHEDIVDKTPWVPPTRTLSDIDRLVLKL